MPASTTLVLDDLDAYAAAIHPGGVNGLLATHAGRFEARLTRLNLHGVQLLRVWEHLGRIAFLDVNADTLLIALPAVPRSSLLWGGVPTGSNELLIAGPGSAVHARLVRPSRWGEIRIDLPLFTKYGRALMGEAFRVPRDVRLWRPSGSAFEALTSLHAAAMGRTQSRPEVPWTAREMHGLEQELIEVITDCLSEGAIQTNRLRSDVMVRFERLCQANPDRALRLTDLSTALGISEQILRALCRAHLGMDPEAYPPLYRLHQVRRSLRSAPPTNTQIVEIAIAHGFTDWDQFSADYFGLFGEAPSATPRPAAPHR